jgi:predicted nucleotidyltransferase
LEIDFLSDLAYLLGLAAPSFYAIVEAVGLKKKTREGLRSLRIGVVYLVGSQASGEQGPVSDFDLAVVFSGDEQPINKMAIHPVLYDILTDEFPVTLKNDVDIIYLQEAALSFQFEAISTGRVIYESNPELRVDYEESVVKRYLDFAPVEKMFSTALMERLS